MGTVGALRTLAPDLLIDYLADTALFPYGEQPDHVLISRLVMLLTEATRLLGSTLVVIGCNTASTLALPALRQALDVPVVGQVPPIRWAGRVSRTRTIGLLATSATARRDYVRKLHTDFAADCRLIIHGGRALADLAERAFAGEDLSLTSIAHEVAQLFSQPGGENIDTIGLGCTHYTFLMPFFRQLGLRDVLWLDPAPAVAQQVLRLVNASAAPPPTARDSAPQSRRGVFLMTALPEHTAEFTSHLKAFGFSGCRAFTLSGACA
ncbi:glutamate racemase [Oecophyllibacter saccharovorans]|uniref:glutamate racemase n=1 Tax=Oecophyllibacter saccharovorans TaxID=2558360 RepID=UPI00116A9E47|nr:aspartate/glutamate racemase family protein [Oecophyllibacter saccharovorans]TPW35318.1 glutamate racemase [Oecophyllibacter saccharovorans]